MKDIQELITEKIDIWTSAVERKNGVGRGSNKKVELYGIKKLRELILELAVRGKLVPQAPNDEPASVLLERIASEKKQLIKKGKIKKQKKLPPISNDEKPFDLPNGWEWVRISDLFSLENGDRGKNYPNKSLLVQEGIPFVNAGHLLKGRINENEMTYISEERFNLLRSGKFKDGDIIFCLRGTLGKSALVENFSKGAIASSLIILRPYKEIDSYYSLIYFEAPLALQMIKKYDNGTAQPNLSASNLEKFSVPLPPKNEQLRIVTKVNDLMSLCDQLEQQTEASLSAHKTLVETLLATLTNYKNSEELTQNWNRISDHFETLFTTEDSIEQLKQTILQLAVMGKLVPQDPNDEPASVLLKKIAKEKEKLIKEGRIKKQKKLPPVSDNEKPFDLPNGWEWCRLQDITKLITDGKHGNCNDQKDSGYYFLSAKDIQNGKLIYENARQIVQSEFQEVHNRTNLEPNDLCLVNTGATIGKSAIALDHPLTYRTTFQKSVAVIKVLKPFINHFYISNLLISETSKLLQNSGGSAINNLLLGDLKKQLVPLPPAQEQNRIVTKVDHLIKLFNQLKTSITENKSTQLKIANTITEETVT